MKQSFARIAVPLGWQVLAVDLPEHGERAGNSSARFDPWHSVPELHGIISSLRSKNKRVALRAVSIGAWFSLLAARGISLECCLLVSPLLNMERMIADMMRSANISEDTLKEVGEIVVPNGTVLSYDYLLYARRNPPTLSCLNAKVLWGENDAVVPFDTVEAFCKANHCGLTVMPAGEHWFHTAGSANSCLSGKVRHSPNSEFKHTLSKMNFGGSYGTSNKAAHSPRIHSCGF